jgi:drug/metabolite transporter (DMT)-like permease
MLGLAGMAASEAALLLNAEAVFTAAIAWIVFRENVDLRVGLGFAAIAAGAVLVATGGGLAVGGLWPSLAVLGACLAWGIDNNLTRRVSLADASWIACVKGLAAGSVNTAIGLALGAALPPAGALAGALLLGFLAYGVSLTLIVVALRELGTARAGAYFATAPFFGAAVAVGMGEPVTGILAAAGALMALGVWLHLSERHAHAHTHEAVEHTHWHTHDAHHMHAHAVAVPAGTWHRHPHRHEAITHSHAHYPDAHHRHVH